jgi:elongation factor Ts
LAEISATAVKSLREQTGLPLMECKRALTESGGDVEGAIEFLRKAGKAKMIGRAADRETSFGRLAVFASIEPPVGSIIEIRCESAPVASNEEFIKLAHNLAEQLALGAGVATPEALLDEPSPGKPGSTLRQQFDDLNNRIREVFRLARIQRLDGACGGYVHHDGANAVLLQIEGGNPEVAKDICMHIAASRPIVVAKEDLDPQLVAKEREILSAQARQEGKPEKIIEKMVEGRLRDFYARHCLLEQPFVKDSDQTVGQVAKAAGMKIVRFVHWMLGKE